MCQGGDEIVSHFYTILRIILVLGGQTLVSHKGIINFSISTPHERGSGHVRLEFYGIVKILFI